MLFYLIRHGDPIYVPDSLTPLGKRQAEAVAKRLARYGINRVYTSTSNRAIETAKPLCELLNIKHTELDWCNESHMWRNFTIINDSGHRVWMNSDNKMRKLFVSPEVRKLDKNWFDHPGFADANCKEGVKFLEKSVDAFFKELGYLHDRENNMFSCIEENDERVALFAHEGFSLAFLSAVLDIPYPMICTHFGVNHSSVTVLKFNNTAECFPVVLSFSNDAHIYSEGLPTRFNNGVYF